jgi:hypothetical protein
MDWENIGRPGFFGKKRDEIYKGLDSEYCDGNWRIMWRWGEQGRIIIPYLTACQRYEDAYFIDSFQREGVWKELKSKAKNVFDYDPSDIKSGLDYLVQQGSATHVQDIAIRNVFFRRGWDFEGNELAQIRSHKTYWGQMLSPGKVKFHLPDMIINPHLAGWWDYDSVEDFYQSNKILQVRKKQ